MRVLISKIRNYVIEALWLFQLIGILGFIIGFLVWWFNPQFKSNGEIFLYLIALLIVCITVSTYEWSRDHERVRFANEKKHEFITNNLFTDIQSRIEHNDSELQIVIAIINTAYDPWSETNLNQNQKLLHENFDCYVNWIESLAILLEQKLIRDEDIIGFWEYYLMRLMKVELSPPYEPQEYHDEPQEYHVPEIRDPITSEKIDPCKNPIWYYINNEEYKFKISDLIKRLVVQKEKKRSKNKN